MGIGNNYVILRQLCPLLCIGHMVHVFPLYLNCSAGCPSQGAAISTWICMCLLRNWTAEGMLAWDWWSSGIMRKAPLFVGPLVHRDLTLWGLACVGWGYCPSFFPPPFFFAVLHSHAPERGKKVAFHWSTCTGTNWGGEPVSWLQMPFMSYSPATCVNATKWLITLTSRLQDWSECTAEMAALLSGCNFVHSWMFMNGSGTSSEIRLNIDSKPATFRKTHLMWRNVEVICLVVQLL